MEKINCYDVCVIGAGPAGITSALELADKGLSVVLVESGKEEFNLEIQSLSDGEVVTLESHSIMEDAVRRGLGGTSNIWGGRCVPLDPIDHERRSYVAQSGWPVTYSELEPYYKEACVYLGVDSPDFLVKTCKKLPTSHSKLSESFKETANISAHNLERWSKEPKIWRIYGEKIKSHPGITLLDGYTCIAICQLDEDKAVSSIKVADINKDAPIKIIQARTFVLACGGIESTRLLLSSMEDENGIKIEGSAHIGRFYMGHPSGKIADIELNGAPAKTLFGFEKDGNVYTRRHITLTDEVMRKEQLLNIAFWLDNPDLADWQHGSGMLSAAYLALTAPLLGNLLAPAAIRKRLASDKKISRFKHLKNCMRSPVGTALFATKFVYKRYWEKPRLPGFFTYSSTNRYALHYHAEQVPNYNSCITLSNVKDALGLRRAKIQLIWSQQDIDSIIRAHQILDNELQKSGAGCLSYRYLPENIEKAIQEQAIDGFHQIGTLRMTDSAENGVVDSYGCIYGTSNFYVASSAIFPTSGQANPTLALIALVVRQAEHIAEKFNIEKSENAWTF